MSGHRLLAVLLALVSAPALAVWSGPETASARTPTPAEAFAEQADAIREELRPGGQYSHLSASQQRKVDEQLKLMASMLDGVDDINKLRKEKRVRMFNAQEQLNALLLAQGDDQLVCERTKVTGSHRTTTVCMTMAQKTEAEESSDRLFQTYNRSLKSGSN